MLRVQQERDGGELHSLRSTLKGLSVALIAFEALRCAGGESAAIVYPPPEIPVLVMPDGRVFSMDAPSTLAYAIEADPRTGQLVLLDFYADRPLVLLSPDGVVAGRYGARGEGPGEFDDVRSLSIGRGLATVWDYDLGRLGVLDLSRPAEVETRRVPVPEGKSVLEVEMLADGRKLVVGRMGSALAYVVHDTLLTPLGDPDSVADLVTGTTERMRDFFSQASAAVNEDLDLVALGYLDTGWMVLTDLSNGHIIAATQPGSWPEPKLVKDVGNPMQHKAPENFVGYRSVHGSRDGVWGLFVGNTWDRSFADHSSRDIHAYDWRGNLHAILRLPVRVDDIAVLGDTLFGAVNDPAPAILSWTIPASLMDQLRP